MCSSVVFVDTGTALRAFPSVPARDAWAEMSAVAHLASYKEIRVISVPNTLTKSLARYPWNVGKANENRDNAGSPVNHTIGNAVSESRHRYWRIVEKPAMDRKERTVPKILWAMSLWRRLVRAKLLIGARSTLWSLRREDWPSFIKKNGHTLNIVLVQGTELKRALGHRNSCAQPI